MPKDGVGRTAVTLESDVCRLHCGWCCPHRDVERQLDQYVSRKSCMAATDTVGVVFSDGELVLKHAHDDVAVPNAVDERRVSFAALDSESRTLVAPDPAFVELQDP